MRTRPARITTTSIVVPSTLSRTHPVDQARNLALAARYLKHAGEIGSDLVLLPEGFATKGLRQTFTNTRASYGEVCEPIPGGEASELAAAHALKYRMYVVAPIFERDGRTLYNTAALFDRRGRLAGKYRKIHLPPPGEPAVFAPGNQTPVFDLDFGRVAIAICWDLNFPELARTYALNGAELLCWPTMWGDSADYQLTYMRGQALANVLFFAGANYCMPGHKGGHPGQSAIIAPDGRVLANTGNRPGIASTRIDLNHPRFKERAGLIAGRRPELYRQIAQPVPRPSSEISRP
jgi:predicted amidohydrolase